MGFRLYQHFDDKDISTEYSALMSKVMANGNDRVKFPINEPAEGRKKSQIEEYLDFYHGPGVQHIAMATDNIIDTVSKLRDSGYRVPARAVHLLRGPGTARRQDRRAHRPACRNSAFWWIATTRATCCRSSPSPWKTGPRYSYEMIQRKGSRSFGKGNFKALFEAIEREQALRGNL